MPEDLETLVEPIASQLKTNFSQVKVSVEECPDLTEWGLPLPGIGCADPQRSAVVEAGGIRNFKTSALQYKNYSFQ